MQALAETWTKLGYVRSLLPKEAGDVGWTFAAYVNRFGAPTNPPPRV